MTFQLIFSLNNSGKPPNRVGIDFWEPGSRKIPVIILMKYLFIVHEKISILIQEWLRMNQKVTFFLLEKKFKKYSKFTSFD